MLIALRRAKANAPEADLKQIPLRRVEEWIPSSCPRRELRFHHEKCAGLIFPWSGDDAPRLLTGQILSDSESGRYLQIPKDTCSRKLGSCRLREVLCIGYAKQFKRLC